MGHHSHCAHRLSPSDGQGPTPTLIQSDLSSTECRKRIRTQVLQIHTTARLWFQFYICHRLYYTRVICLQCLVIFTRITDAIYKLLSHTISTAIFQVNLGNPAAPSAAWTGRWGCHKVLQAVPSGSYQLLWLRGFCDTPVKFWCFVKTSTFSGPIIKTQPK